MRKIALYCRVSTAHQEKEQTIETQISKLKNSYKKEKIVKEYKDVCSGAYLSRKSLNQLREDAKKRMFDAVCVYSLDRLSRKLGHQIALIEEFEKQGVKIEVLGENYEDTPEGMLNRNIRGAFSEYERYRITQRMRDGKYRKLENGEFVACTPSYGYKVVKENGKARLDIEPTEAKMVKSMFKTYLEEHGLGKTARKIYDMNFRARTERNGEHIAISPFMISHILRNEVYIGNFYFGKTYACEPERPIKENRKYQLSARKYRPRSEWKLIKVPAIIDKPAFDRVQDILKTMAKSSLKPTRHYLCQGLIKCVRCGYRYIGKMKSKSHREEAPNGSHYSYLCPKKAMKRSPSEPYCHSREISTNRLDDYVWERVKSLILDKEKVKKSARALREKRESERDFNQNIYDGLIAEKGKLKEEKGRLLGLYADDTIRKEDLDEKISEFNSREDNLEWQIKEAEKELAKIEETHALEEEIEQTCLEYQDTIKDADFDLKRRILKKWVKKINLPDKGGIILTVRIPPPEKPVKFQFSTNKVGVASVSPSK